MVKRLNLATRAFGAEPDQPDMAGLAEWVADHRGRVADIVMYHLDRSLAPQLDAGITTPCAGGKFYADRIRQCLGGVLGNRAVGELHVDCTAITEDAAAIVVQKKGAWCAMPSPQVLGIADAHYGDEDEWRTAICGAYRTLMRAMRDTGVAGHVLIADRVDDAELASLARQKVFFFQTEMDRESCATLMEYQAQIAVGKEAAGTVLDLADEYTLQRIILIDPDKVSIDLALSHLDPDQVAAGGYCRDNCGEYWKTLSDNAFYWK